MMEPAQHITYFVSAPHDPDPRLQQQVSVIIYVTTTLTYEICCQITEIYRTISFQSYDQIHFVRKICL